jgi:ubiquinol-cytochrome c reductase cytochrome c subunit
MGDDLLYPLDRPMVSGPRLVLLAGFGFFALLVLALGGRDRASASSASGLPVSGLPGSGLAVSTRQVAFTPQRVEAGRQLFVVHCSSCHGLDAQGTANGPSVVDAGAASADFYLRTGRMPLNDPHQQPVRHAPAFPPDQIADLVAYVGSLDAGPPIPAVAPGDISDGQAMYSINCAQCHNVAGAGGALGYGDIVPSLRSASPLDVVEAARIGPAPMPVFGPQTLSDQQVSDIATYVQYLHHPQDRGGFGLGHLGPIPEGFAGWVVGMGALLLVARLIGTRG